MGWADVITLLGLVIVVLNALLQQPVITPDLVVIITFVIGVLNGLIAVLKYFFPESAVVKAARR